MKSIKIKNIDILKGSSQQQMKAGFIPSQYQLRPESVNHLLAN